MIGLDENALICDLAETYQIYDYRQLPLSTVAVFSCGLRDNSRIKMIMSQQTISLENILLASISDKLSYILWSKTKDGYKGKNEPSSILDMLLPQRQQEKDEITFKSGEDFERMRKELLETTGIGGGD